MGVKQQVLAGLLGTTGALAAPGNVTGIPDRALLAYVEAAAEAPCAVQWFDLAAVGVIESGHGTSAGAHLQDDGTMTRVAVSTAGALGPMQFMPATWAQYGQGDVNDVDDAARATARKLCADGFDRDPIEAIGSYNGGGLWRQYLESQGYVQHWQQFRDEYRRADPTVVVAPAVGKERTPGRLGENVWAALMRGWVRTGQGAAILPGGERAWRAVDDAAFGADTVARHDPDLSALPARDDQLDPVFGARLDPFLATARAAGHDITITEGFRTPQVQRERYLTYLAGGNLAAYSDGVHCESEHCDGRAVDLGYPDDRARAWAHANCERFGLRFTVPSEDWHLGMTP